MKAASASGPAGAPLRLLGRTELPDYSGDFDHFAVDVPGNRLFLAAEDHGTLEVFDLRSGRHLKTVKGVETPHSILYMPDRNRLLVTDGPGYALRAAPDAVDAWRFETAVGGTRSPERR